MKNPFSKLPPPRPGGDLGDGSGRRWASSADTGPDPGWIYNVNTDTYEMADGSKIPGNGGFDSSGPPGGGSGPQSQQPGGWGRGKGFGRA